MPLDRQFVLLIRTAYLAYKKFKSVYLIIKDVAYIYDQWHFMFSGLSCLPQGLLLHLSLELCDFKRFL